MATIDIGPGATDRASSYSNFTRTTLDQGNPANDTGTLDTFEIFANVNCTGVKIGTFSGSGTSWDDRDYESIGNVTAGSKQTFTGKNCDVSANDLLGIFFAGYGAKLEYDITGGSGILFVSGDVFGSGAQTYASGADRALSIYATGVTAGGGPTPAIKVGGVWKETTSQKIKVGGAWKAISNIKVKVSGVWKSAT